MHGIPSHVVAAYADKYSLSPAEAEERFARLDGFLASAADRTSRPDVLVDHAWHAFLLYTREYREYCDRRFGVFIDHTPDQGSSSLGSSCSAGAPSPAPPGGRPSGPNR